MGNKRRSYSREFKLEAVALVTDGGLSVVQRPGTLGSAREFWGAGRNNS